MHPVLFNESFSFCSRDDLERLQPVSQSLLDIVVAGSNVLPLRPIHCVKMLSDLFQGSDDSEDSFQIFVAGPVDGADADESEPDYTASIPDGDFTENFRRLQNTCIKYFCVGVRESPFLRYWKAQEAAAFVVVSIAVDLPEAADYGVLDSIVSLLRPKSTEISIEESSWDENDHNDVYKKYLGLLARESYLNNLQTCHLQVRGDAFPSPTFFLQERGYSNYELWCIDSNVADRIDGFIEVFMFSNNTLRWS
ncbi:hypothetical protein AAVH_23248 [Aphelenchoides avenae]|nr:hypothetical protein AAVH_23248 [Aphelenchus avenae]